MSNESIYSDVPPPKYDVPPGVDGYQQEESIYGTIILKPAERRYLWLTQTLPLICCAVVAAIIVSVTLPLTS